MEREVLQKFQNLKLQGQLVFKKKEELGLCLTEKPTIIAISAIIPENNNHLQMLHSRKH